MFDLGFAGKSFWSSGTRTSNNGTFFWMESGQNLTYTNWGPGEPNKHPFFSEPEECIQLRSSYGLKWNDVACEYDYNVICEN